MLNALADNRNSSTDAFQCGNVSISRHRRHSPITFRENRDLIMLGTAGDCGPEGLFSCQDL
jgi:hypothetical protein